MARNQEKANSMLFRFRETMAAEHGVVNIRSMARPKVVNSVKSVSEAERWRFQCIQDAAKHIKQIQSPGIPEAQLRELNDYINKLMREKRAWEWHIKELGGPDYTRSGPLALSDGKEIPGNRGYKYFGRAKDLPGVKELLEPVPVEVVEAEELDAPRRRAALLRSRCDDAYFGMRDEEDEEVHRYERGREDELRRQIGAADDRSDGAENTGDSHESAAIDNGAAEGSEVINRLSVELDDDVPAIHVPTQAEVEEYLLNRRKQELLNRYASSDMIESEREARTLSGLR